MQGDPLDMVAYGIGVLPLIKRLKATYPDVTRTWYTENAGALGTYKNIELYLIQYNNLAWVMGITPDPQQSF